MTCCRLLVKELEANERTASGIIVPTAMRMQEHRGIVMEHGSFCGGDEFEVGDVVVWAEDDPHHPDPLRIKLDLAENGEQEEFVVLHAQEVLMVLEDVADRERV